MRHTEIHNGINNYEIIVKATLRLALSTLKDCLLHTSMPACVRNGSRTHRSLQSLSWRSHEFRSHRVRMTSWTEGENSVAASVHYVNGIHDYVMKATRYSTLCVLLPFTPWSKRSVTFPPPVIITAALHTHKVFPMPLLAGLMLYFMSVNNDECSILFIFLLIHHYITIYFLIKHTQPINSCH